MFLGCQMRKINSVYSTIIITIVIMIMIIIRQRLLASFDDDMKKYTNLNAFGQLLKVA